MAPVSKGKQFLKISTRGNAARGTGCVAKFREGGKIGGKQELVVKEMGK
jgi:hypothetical protein